jgi:hypothetical protein
MELFKGLMPFIKVFILLLKPALMIFEHIKKYSYLRKAKPMELTIGTKTNVGSTLFTTGRVVSVNIHTVIIEGYQVNDPVTTHGIFKISLHKISGINSHQNC